jgi:Lsr2
VVQRIHTVLVDDLDGSDAAGTVTFGIDSVTYEIDLSADHAAELRDCLAQYVAHGRRQSGRSSSRRSAGGRSSRTTSGPSPAEVRDWAKAQGRDVSDRGRVPAEVRAAYDAAH